jgi:PAS domain S-box-containing protein
MFSSSTRFEKLLEAVPDALVGMDQNGVIRFVNLQTELLFGYNRDKLIGQHIGMLVPETLWELYTEHQERYFADPRTRSSGVDVELTGRHQNGREFPINLSMSQIDTGDVLLVITAVSEVTKQQEAIRNAGLTAAMVESSGDAIIGLTLEGTITRWNAAAERLYGYSSREILGRAKTLLVPEDRLDEPALILNKVGAGEHVQSYETWRVRKDGTHVPVSLTASSIRDLNGEIIGASEIHRDMTEQRNALEAARLMASIVENSDDAIVSITLNGIIQTWNAAAERMFGYTSEEIIGKTSEYLMPPDRLEESQALVGEIIAGRRVQNLDTLRTKKDGKIFPVSLTASPIRNADGLIIGVSAIARDITEQKDGAAAAQRMVAIVENSYDAIVSLTLDREITSWNPAAERIYGYSKAEIMGASADRVTPKDRAKESVTVQDKIRAGRPVERLDTYRLHRDGTVFPVSITVSPMRGTNGSVNGTSIIVRDLTDPN